MTAMTVNERPVDFDMDPETPLLHALRDAANLTGTKFGCGEGDCGACMVHVDGEALRSCLITIAEAEGRFITTIEGLSRDRSHPVQQAMVAEQAIQCGYCTPGIVMAASALGTPRRKSPRSAPPNRANSRARSRAPGHRINIRRWPRPLQPPLWRLRQLPE